MMFSSSRRGATKKVVDDVWKVARQDGKIFESTNMRGREKEHLLGIVIVAKSFYADLQGGGFRAFDVSVGFVDVPTVQAGPTTRGAR